MRLGLKAVIFAGLFIFRQEVKAFAGHDDEAVWVALPTTVGPLSFVSNAWPRLRG